MIEASGPPQSAFIIFWVVIELIIVGGCLLFAFGPDENAAPPPRIGWLVAMPFAMILAPIAVVLIIIALVIWAASVSVGDTYGGPRDGSINKPYYYKDKE